MKQTSMNLAQNSEELETELLFQWAELSAGRYPELKLMYHIPNEGKRSRAAAGRLKAQGLKAGVPDVCLPVARQGYHALYIEMKREKGGRVSDKQKQWLQMLNDMDNLAVVCCGFEAARKVIEEYLQSTKGCDAYQTARTLSVSPLEKGD